MPSPLHLVFVAGVLTGVAVVTIARLTPDVIWSVRYWKRRLREHRAGH